ncbi:hypothetical protein [Methylocucumis oryzae]|uniref:hypothetical protein n=1 Tax=Methylocucumis oryzae TaxID=1632867 RepID=UPI00069658BA|nr:hypothetical protein [Methylocucumis oryzae]
MKTSAFLLYSVIATMGVLFNPNALAGTPVKYLRSVHDASIAQASEIVTTLDAITPDNTSLVWNQDKTQLKVVTWKSQSSYQNYLLPYTQTSSSEKNVVWVTLAPKMQEFCRDYLQTHPNATPSSLDYRLKQRLGLNPDWQYDVFVEMWVAPEDIFRPCVDPDTSDSQCELDFTTQLPVVKNIQDYKAFLSGYLLPKFSFYARRTLDRVRLHVRLA